MPTCDNPGTGGGGSSSFPFKGAFVTLAVNQPLPDNVGQIITFGVEQYDIGGWFDPGDPTKLTVPADVTRVRVCASFVCTLNVNGMRQIVIKKNGADIGPGTGALNTPANARTTTDIGAFTAVLEVVPGDYFQVEALQDSGTDPLDLLNACFSIEKIS